jgi:acyl-CoA synthetase (AMP-forming)/AMP-acid ligase II
MNVSVLLDVAAAMDADRPIVVDTRGRWTLAAVKQRALSFAGLLAELGRPGPVAYIDSQSADVPACFFGSSYAGRPFAPLNFRGDRNLIEHCLRVLEPAVVVCGDRYRPLIPSGVEVWSPEDTLSGLGTDGGVHAEAFDPDAVAAFVFTSGTTSAPKAAALKHRHLTAYVLGTTEPLGEPPSTATLVATPNYHIATVANVLTSTYAGRRMVFLDRFTPANWLATARNEAITHAFVVPTMLQRITQALAAGETPPASLRVVAYGGAPTARTTIEAALTLFGAGTGFVNAYGLTETSSTISLLTPDDHREAFASEDPEIRSRLDSVGSPLQGVEVRLDEAGQILVRGAQVSGEYSGAERRVLDGWLATGDLGRIDDAGFLFIEGRLDDMIIRGGENISPLEIEEVLRRFPEVAEAVVVGVSDLEWGQRIVAAVELREPVNPEELSARLVPLLPSFKRPERIVVLDELPRTDLGKLQRRRVRDLLTQEPGEA